MLRSRFAVCALPFVIVLPFLFAMPAHAQFADVELRGNTMCAITTDDVGICSERPQLIMPSDLPKVRDIAGAQSAACVVTEAGELRCWGQDGYGLTNPPSVGAPYSSVSMTLAHACAINKDSAIECWGLASNDRLKAPQGAFQQVSVGPRQACAVDFNGAVSCWGLNEFGTTDVPSDLPSAKKVQAGSAASCALLLDGTIRCWGLTMFVPKGGPFVDFSATMGASVDGANASGGICGLDGDGFIDCEFTNLFNGNLTSPSYGDEPSDGGNRDVSVGGSGACYVNAANDIQCFGLIFADIPTLQSTVPTTTGLTALVYSSTAAELVWDAPRNASLVAGHEIQRNGEVVAFTQNLSSYFIDDLEPGIPTNFSVRQIAFNGDSGIFPPPVTVTTGSGAGTTPTSPTAYTPPNRQYEPTGLVSFIYGPTTVEVVWDRVNTSVIRGYEIRRDGVFIQFTNGISFIDDVPDDSGTVRYDVIPVGHDDSSQILGIGSITVNFGAEPEMCQ